MKLKDLLKEAVNPTPGNIRREEIKSKLQRMPLFKKADLQIEDNIRIYTNRTNGKKKYVVMISYPISKEMPYGFHGKRDSGGEIINKAVKRVFGSEYDVDYSFISLRRGKYSDPWSVDGKRITVEFTLQDKDYYKK